jgi:putative copper export protein/mono/diheme cytochrome c family protein
MASTTILLAVLRGTHLLALLLLLGTLVALLGVAPEAALGAGPEPRLARHRLLLMARVAALAALVIGFAWLVTQAVVMGSADTVSRAMSVLLVVVNGTRFGQVVLIRLMLIVLAALLLRERPLLQAGALILTMLSAALQGLVGHAGAIGGVTGDWLIASEALHLVAAGAWLGALPALLLLVGTLRPHEAATVCRRFSPIGLSAVLVIMGTAMAQATALIGGFPALIGTSYGHIAVLKLDLFVLLLVLASINRFNLTARFDHADPVQARRSMRVSLSFETLFGAAVIVTASFLGSSVPAEHVQPVWPFAWRPSLVAMSDPDLRQEVIGALAAVAAAVAMVVLGLSWRRLRWPALAIAVVVAWRAVPHLGLLLVPAFPTSYYQSPTGFSADSIARGTVLFQANCAACHGASGQGNGPRAAQLPERPADLTALHLWEHSDGELFWWISHGIEAPEGGMAMPGFAATLSDDDRWALIDEIRAHNAGATMAGAGRYPVPIRAPAFPIVCNGASGSELADLRGAVVLIVADAGLEMPPSPVSRQDGIRVVTVVVTPNPGAPAGAGAGECAAASQGVWPALAVLAGVAPSALSGTQFLIDPAGWLRAVARPGVPGGWNTREQLVAAIRRVIDTPIAEAEPDAHAHHH